MINKLIIVGNVGKDAEMRFTPNGKPVTSFSVATSSGYGDKKETTWFTVQTFGKTAEFANEYISKGSMVYVEGRVKLNQWEGKDGKSRASLEVIANEIKLLNKKESDGYERDYIEPEDIPF
jgi:single-strand DNA-binding protein